MAHDYSVTVTWAGNKGTGTSAYTAYARDHVVSAPGKPDLKGSADPSFRGDATRWNPEELFLASLSACHKLWYLHLAADAGITVTAYVDRAEATLTLHADGSGEMTSVTLNPNVTISAGDPQTADALHAAAHAKCFIAASVKTPIRYVATTKFADT